MNRRVDCRNSASSIIKTSSMTTLRGVALLMLIGSAFPAEGADTAAPTNAGSRQSASEQNQPALLLPPIPARSGRPQSIPEVSRSTANPETVELQKRKQQSFERLQQQAEALVKHLGKLKHQQSATASADRQLPPKNPDSAAEVDTTAPQLPAPASADLSPGQSTSVTTPSVFVPLQPIDLTPVQSLPPFAEAPTNTSPGVQDSVSAPQMEDVVTGPIDRLGLATSLYATRQYQACLQTLKSVDRETLTAANKDWCSYLDACCYQKTGNQSEAESRYRDLVAHTSEKWLADSSRWWLDHLNERQKLKADLTQLKTTIKAWQEEVHALSTAD